MYYARDAPLKEIEFSTFYWQRKNRADIVNDDIMCFDIETSSAFKHSIPKSFLFYGLITIVF